MLVGKQGIYPLQNYSLLTGSQTWKCKAVTLQIVLSAGLLKRGHQLLSRYSCKNCQTQLFMKNYFTGGSSENNSSSIVRYTEQFIQISIVQMDNQYLDIQMDENKDLQPKKIIGFSVK